nr:head maturation protease, ClpP-related [Streptomyces sp. TLI_235]
MYDEIGGYWGISAADFVSELSQVNASAIDVHINSPGGEIFDGIAIANALAQHPATVTSYVDSLAASIASVIALAGDRVVMAPRSQLMIHDGSGYCMGNAADMRGMAELLDRQSDNIASVYAEKAGGDVADWRALMTEETWYTAEEAVAAGLADEVSSSRTSPDENSSKNSWDLASRFRYPNREAAPAPVPVNSSVGCPPGPSPAPVAEPPAVEPATDPAPPAAAEPPQEPEPSAEPAAVEPQPEPEPAADPWATATAHLTTTAPSTDDAFRRLTEALL